MFWHRHKWEEVGRTVNPPSTAQFSEPVLIPRHDWQRLMFGFTIIELRCTICGDVSSREILGASAMDRCRS